MSNVLSGWRSVKGKRAMMCVALPALLHPAVWGEALGAGPDELGSQAMMCGQDASPVAWSKPLEPLDRAPEVSFSAAEQQCWLSPAQVFGKPPSTLPEPNRQWVDVRAAGEVQRMAPTGVPHVPLENLRDRAFLKGLPIALIGNGVDLKALSAQCVRLRDSGQYPDVKVLLGGIRVWERAGQAVVHAQGGGGASAASQGAEVFARDAWLGAANGVWEVVSLGLGQAEQAKLPKAPRIHVDTPAMQDGQVLSPAQTRQVLQQLETALASTDLSAPRQWLIVAPNEPLQRHLMRAAQETMQSSGATASPLSTALAQASWLAGGSAAYAAYLQEQHALAQNAGQALPRICGM